MTVRQAETMRAEARSYWEISSDGRSILRELGPTAPELDEVVTDIQSISRLTEWPLLRLFSKSNLAFYLRERLRAGNREQQA